MTNTSLFRLALGASLFLLAGCSLKQDMALQPKDRPLAPSDFFTDGRSARPLVENTVARGSVLNDELMVPKDSNAFPLPINLELVERGENRYIYDVITNGFGAMLGYSAQVAPRDRWAIIAYVRALQLSRNAKISDLPPDVREKVLHPPAEKPETHGEGAPGGKTE